MSTLLNAVVLAMFAVMANADDANYDTLADNECFALFNEFTEEYEESSTPTFKLPMCKMYTSKACCRPIQDAETQWAFSTLVDVADRCIQNINKHHFPLREFFCIPCDPDQSKYLFVSKDENTTENSGKVKICKSFLDEMWPVGEDGSIDSEKFKYDDCGFTIFTNDEGVVPYGDVDGTTGDDPIIPSLFWNSSVEAFINDIKPAFLDGFDFEVIDDSEADHDDCFPLAGESSALQVKPAIFLVALSMVLFFTL